MRRDVQRAGAAARIPPLNWTEEYDRKLLSFKQTGEVEGLRFNAALSFAEIARRLNAWYGVDEFTKDSVQKRFRSLSPLPDYGTLYPSPQPTPYFDKYFTPEGKPKVPQAQTDVFGTIQGMQDSGRWVKTLVLSDTQGVFADNAMWEAVIAENLDADIVVIPGDVCDWEGASKYTHEMDYPLRHEADWYVRFLEILEAAFPGKPKIVTDSNHRRRISKAIRSLPQGLLFLADHNPERYLAQPFPYVLADDSWWIQIGDTIYAHKEGRTATPGDNARDAIRTFRTWRDAGQHNVQQFRMVVTGHSHKVSEHYESGVKGMEPGCLARLPMLYMSTAEIANTQDNGYAVVIQKDGRADRNASRVIKLGGDD